jgi:hypothetical protein
MDSHHIIGEIEHINFPEISSKSVIARIDTGAHSSAIWVSSIVKTNQGLEVIFFDKHTDYYDGQPIIFSEYSQTIVRSSNGIHEKRYKVKLLVVIDGRRIRAWFTLADRSKQKYAVLIGRNVLRSKFVVDVSKKLRKLTN